MKKFEFEQLEKLVISPRTVSGAMLVNKTPGTLMYGYTCNRDTFHLYLDDAEVIQCVTYSGDGLLLSHAFGELEARKCVPDKRLCPERCDYEFCALLLSLQVSLPFTIYDDKVKSSSTYDGRLLSELKVVPSEHLRVAPPLVLLEELGIPGVHLGQMRMSERTILDGRIIQTVQDYLDGYLKAVLVRDEGLAAEKWLRNIPESIQYNIRKALTENNPHLGIGELAELYSISPEVSNMVIERCRCALDAHFEAHGITSPNELATA